MGLGEDFSSWLVELEAIGSVTPSVHLPDKHQVSGLFTRLGVQPADAAEILDAWPALDQSPEWWWLLHHCHLQLVALMDKPFTAHPPQWRPLPQHLGSLGRLFYVYVFLATLPAIRQWHHQRGIPDDVSWATLADLGENLAIHRRMFGVAGLDVPQWLTLHFGGKLYRLARLQFERWRLSPRWAIYSNEGSDNGVTLRPGAPALSVHIPESGGPLSPDICSESFEQARSFFAHHFPEETYNFARCSSWLLDPQLADYLPSTSNIVRFQRRFHLVPGGVDDDLSIIRFVFRRAAFSLDDLPQRTALERAVVAHLRAGEHWQVRSGWLTL
ncbi:hypothetical protein KSF_012300 [Reticulibacter mediterranei]|uniref:Acyltransferase n=1 Tax=Reticulibacter mediterranei TaxID=2778369 RepID=A0A8J3IGP9_9CHLR|nr:hypothetical protein KSF_012300 [Reticulibacter mediterranei]